MCPSLDDLREAERAGGLALIRCLVALGQYTLSRHADELWGDGCFELEDLENAIQEGDVYKTEADEMNNSLGNTKYVIVGPDACGYDFYCVGKILIAEEGKMYFVITAHSFEVNDV